MHYFYIIYSPSSDAYYSGETNSMQERLKKHNEHYYQKAFTNIATDWNVRLLYECEDRDDALYLESFVKRMKSRVFLKKVIGNVEILSDILSKQ